tara:strand:+ start:621 stop:5102 length:4482 start_codon:yes stop_codon:yes gene_type:complete
MTTITQDIPNFLNGISQQPDKKKIPTQVSDAINTYPDYALGMLKRPGGKFISNLYNAEDISTSISSATHNGVGDGSRTAGRYVAAATSTTGSGTGATFNVHAIVAGEVKTFTHNGVAASNRTAGTYYVANAAGSASGTGCDLKVVVEADGEPIVTLDNRNGKTGGAGYNASGETITISDSSLGSGGAASVVLTITAIHSLGVDVTLSSGGKGYLKNDTVTIADAALGGGGGAAITVTVAATKAYGKWFSILRDENEKYVGQYADDTFRIWSLIDGSPRKVDMGDDTGVPSGCNYTNLQTDLLAYNNAIADTEDKLSSLNTAQAAFTESGDGQEFTQSSLFETSQDYDSGIGTVTESLISGITQHKTNNTYTIKEGGVPISTSAENLAGPVYKLERTGEGVDYPTNVGTGKVNQIQITAAGSGYSALAANATSGGSGTGLTLKTTVSTGAIATIEVVNAGSGYRVGDTVTLTGGGGNATATIDKVVPGAVYKLAVMVGGSGYSNGTGVATTGTGAGLTVNTTTSAGAITAAVVNAPGSNYTIGDEITVSGGGGNAKLRVVQLGNATTSGGDGTQLTVNITTNTSRKVEPEISVAEVTTVSTFTHNGVADSSRVQGTYSDVTGTSNKVGTGAIFSVTVGEGGEPTVTLVNGGNAYYAGETITISDSSLGSGGGAAIVVTVSTTSIIRSGGALSVSTGYKVDEVITITGGTTSATCKVTELTWKKGKEMTRENPTLASTGLKLFEFIKINPPTHTDAQYNTTTTSMGTAQTNYDNAVSAEATAKGNYDSEVTACVIPGLPDDGYLRGATADDIELLTLNDYTYVLNKNKTVAMTSHTVPAVPSEAFVVIYVTSYNSKYELTINGVAVSYTSVQDATAGDADAPTIVSNLVTNINAAGGAAASCVATAVGPGIHITNVTSITAVGGPQENAIYVFTDKVGDLSRLPVQCVDGYKVQIVNSESVLADDMWVKFSTSGTATSGPGAWEESNGPGLLYKFDPLTMPHQLVRQTDGTFTYGPISWENRDVGDELTNPTPSFVGNTIRNIFFFRNRFGFLSGGNIILSKAASFYDFWAGSAQVATADDPIDISASSTKPVFLNYVQTTSAGLVLFSDNEQFLLSTDSDVLSPDTAKVNTLSAYECETDVPAVNLGSSLAFLSKTPLYSKIFELANISTTDPPSTFNTTGIVPELVPASIDNIAASPGMSMLSLGNTGDSTLYQYRFYQTTDKRAASTWYKWELTGTLVDQFFDASTFYAVTSDGSNVSVSSIDLRQASDEGFLTLSTGEKTDVCMDMWNSNPYRTYNAVTDKTRIFLPFTHITGKTLAVVALGGYIQGTLGATDASVGAVIQPTVEGSAGSEYVDISGDYRGKNLIIGYLYTMTLSLPKFYVSTTANEQVRSDYTSDLIIHRIKVSTGLSGPVKYNVNLTGIPNRTQTVSVIKPFSNQFNEVAMAADGVHDVPVYQRNENVSLSIVGDTPLPVSLLGMTWEGKYNKRFYKRV